MSIEIEKLSNIIEAALLAFGQPLSIDKIQSLFAEEEQVSRQDIREALQKLQELCEGRGVELVEVGSGFRYQARKEHASWVSKLWEEKPPRYSRALLETLVLVAYRQPITRAEIEDIRGVSVSTHIMKTLQERDWVRVVGHKDVPGKPALYATTKVFLDYFNLKSLDELPSLMEIRDLDKISAEVESQGELGQVDAETQPLTDEEDIERLLPDGEADHGDGIEDELEPVLAEEEAEDEGEVEGFVEPEHVVAAEQAEPTNIQQSEVSEANLEADNEEAVTDEETVVVAEALADDSQDVSVNVESETTTEETSSLEAGMESDTEITASEEIEEADTASLESPTQEDAVSAVEGEDLQAEPQFSTTGYGLRTVPTDNDQEESEYDDDQQQANRLSTAESNS